MAPALVASASECHTLCALFARVTDLVIGRRYELGQISCSPSSMPHVLAHPTHAKQNPPHVIKTWQNQQYLRKVSSHNSPSMLPWARYYASARVGLQFFVQFELYSLLKQLFHSQSLFTVKNSFPSHADSLSSVPCLQYLTRGVNTNFEGGSCNMSVRPPSKFVVFLVDGFSSLHLTSAVAVRIVP